MNDLIRQANELRAQAAALEAQAMEQMQAARANVLAQVKSTIAEHNFTIAELGIKLNKDKSSKTGRSHPSAGKKVDAKYKDAFGNIWTGRGVQPRWLADAIANGASLEQFLVTP
jgi:DNA-binding protein H-NS